MASEKKYFEKITQNNSVFDSVIPWLSKFSNNGWITDTWKAVNTITVKINKSASITATPKA